MVIKRMTVPLSLLSPREIEAVRNEAMLLGLMQHRNCSRFYDSFVQGRGEAMHPCILMEFAAAGTLTNVEAVTR